MKSSQMHIADGVKFVEAATLLYCNAQTYKRSFIVRSLFNFNYQ